MKYGNKFWQVAGSTKAVVQVRDGSFHGFPTAESARDRAKMFGNFGFWRLKECKA